MSRGPKSPGGLGGGGRRGDPLDGASKRTKSAASSLGVPSSLVELVVIVATAVGLALLIQAFLVKPYRIPSGSMIPTLSIGQRVLVNRIGTHFGSPSVGDVVVFHPPRGADDVGPQGECGDPEAGDGHDRPCDRATTQRSDDNFIKRVVAGPGDRLRIRGGHVILNGERQKDSFIRPCGADATVPCSFRGAITVPPGHYFMMGDNRGQSADSRLWGPVPEEWIIGGAFATYWPPDRIGIF